MTTQSPSHVLTTEAGVKRYLSSTQFHSSQVTLLAGGNTNFVYRIVLEEPYVHNNCPVHTMVVKHAEAYVATNTSFSLAVERQEYESLAFRRVPEITSSSSVMSLPTVYYEDRVNRVIIMTDAGENSTNLKDLLLKSPPSVEDSRTIGSALGKFLAELHTASHDSKNSTDAPGIVLKEEFSKNTLGRSIAALVSYGSIMWTLSPSPNSPLLMTPPLDVPATQLDKIKAIVEEMKKQIMDSNEALVMGDFWPGNILISLDGGVQLKVTDWEIARPGLAGLDIGQCLAELHQMRFFYPASKNAVDAIISSFTTAYREVVLESGCGLNLVEVARLAASRAGTHIIVLTLVIPSWKKGDKKQREMMKEGIEYILQAHEKDDEWLKGSFVGGLIP